MEERHPTSQPEIDLAFFFRPLGRAFKSLLNLLYRYYFAITYNGILFFSVIFLITAGAFCLRYVLKPSYKTEGIFISHMMPARYCKTLINNLNALKGGRNLEVLAHSLQISENAASTIKNLEAVNTRDTLTASDKDSILVNSKVFSIVLQLDNMQYLDSIQSGILNYLENTPYLANRKKARKESLLEMKAALNTKIKNLDSLRMIVTNSIVPRSQGQGIILGEPINPVSVYQIETYYNREILSIDESLKLLYNTEILQPFLKIRSFNSPNYTLILIVGFLFSLFAALIIAPVFGRKAPPRILA